MKVAELKAELKARGDDAIGLKPELISRLEAIIATSPAPAPEAPKVIEAAAAPQIVEQKHFHFEFGGPIGAIGIMVGLPVIIYGLYFTCG